MDRFIEFLGGFNVQTILSMIFVMWIFVREIEGKIEKLDAKIDQQSQRSDRLYEMFIDLLKSKQ